mmetsp:Transcript_23814/g.22924  ORF Transcript_23814/g.22924 Transcript_23814/m.22924 type:complete len:207 (+) Transcript_23814:319-939(+)
MLKIFILNMINMDSRMSYDWHNANRSVILSALSYCDNTNEIFFKNLQIKEKSYQDLYGIWNEKDMNFIKNDFLFLHTISNEFWSIKGFIGVDIAGDDDNNDNDDNNDDNNDINDNNNNTTSSSINDDNSSTINYINQNNSTKGHYKEQNVYVVFRGSESLVNWYIDFDSVMVNYPVSTEYNVRSIPQPLSYSFTSAYIFVYLYLYR